LCCALSNFKSVCLNEAAEVGGAMVAQRLLLAFALCSQHAESVRASTRLSANPIRRVVTMLQMMAKKIEDEGETESKLHDKFMCYCQTGGAALEKSINEATTKIPALESSIEEAGAAKTQLATDLVAHKADREAANTAMAEASSVREKQASEFAKESAEAKTNIAAMGKAIAALTRGMQGGFLQTEAATVLRKMDLTTLDMDDGDRDTLSAFLQAGSKGGSQDTNEIVGILKQMKESAEKDLKDSTASEQTAIADHEQLLEAKTEEVDALTKMIEVKTARFGDVGVELVNLAADLDDTQKALAEDQKFIVDLDKQCKHQKETWAVREKTRSEELLAIAETVKILNDDDALDLFKKTLSTPSFLQVQVTSEEMIQEARLVLKAGKRHGKHNNYHLDLISLALRGKGANLGKVITKIDKMVRVLEEDQKHDDTKIEECKRNLDEADDEKKVLEKAVSDLEKSINDEEARIETTTAEIAALEAGIAEMDKEVVDRTEQRKQENKDYVEELAANNAAKQLLGIAKNRLNKFYNPKMYKAAPKRNLSEEERITLNMGGTLAPTAAPGGIAGTGVSLAQEDDSEDNDDDASEDENDSESFLQIKTLRSHVAPPPPPESMAAYAKKSEESTGVTQMIDMLIKEMTLEIQELEMNEKDGQVEYEEFIKDAAEKRTVDSKSLTEKESAKADGAARLQADKKEHKVKMTESTNNDKLIMDLHQDCDWNMQNYEVRKQAREGEVDSLKKAKAVLSGADYSFLQLSSSETRTLKVKRDAW